MKFKSHIVKSKVLQVQVAKFRTFFYSYTCPLDTNTHEIQGQLRLCISALFREAKRLSCRKRLDLDETINERREGERERERERKTVDTILFPTLVGPSKL